MDYVVDAAVTGHNFHTRESLDLGRQTGTWLGPASVVRNSVFRTTIPDAFGLSFTRQYQPSELAGTFGSHCVEVVDVPLFFRRVTTALSARAPIKFAEIGDVIYSDRVYMQMTSPPGPIGFVKPRDPYQFQQEVRMLWHVSNDSANKLTPTLISIDPSGLFVRRA